MDRQALIYYSNKMWDVHLREHVQDSLIVQRRAPHSNLLLEEGHSFPSLTFPARPWNVSTEKPGNNRRKKKNTWAEELAQRRWRWVRRCGMHWELQAAPCCWSARRWVSREISWARLWRALCIKVGDHELYLGRWSSTLIKYAFSSVSSNPASASYCEIRDPLHFSYL